ncbi:MAG TPA: MarC family protein [Bryobacteraceae bacterium]|nr:MarC family protein [Bryobacteraceae bacterium]
MDWTQFDNFAKFWLVALSSIFFIVDPLATIPPFLALTAGDSLEKRRRMARQAAWTCFGVLSAFALAGSLIFKVFGITLPAFKIAGGLLLLLVAFEMLQAKRSGTQESEAELREGEEKDEVGVTPLGVPMLAGPGAISTAMVLMGQSRRWWQAIPVFVAIAITAIASYYILASADRVRGRLGEVGIRILMRLMGLVLTAIAVQFMINGIADLGVLPQAPRG